mmetsp:Transcript_10679/g.39530  ORF Transcript_10679/g.39530 Transcript_10679/m.39530 type:complete len:223 (-) Transcript_10679:36-704(-)
MPSDRVGVPGVSLSSDDNDAAASNSPSTPEETLAARGRLTFETFFPSLAPPKNASPSALSDPLPCDTRVRAVLRFPTRKCASLLGSVIKLSLVRFKVASRRSASAAVSPPGPPKALMMVSSFFTLRNGHRVIPCSRQRCFKTVTHKPSFLATSLMGRWKFALSTSRVRLFDWPPPRFLAILSVQMGGVPCATGFVSRRDFRSVIWPQLTNPSACTREKAGVC